MFQILSTVNQIRKNWALSLRKAASKINSDYSDNKKVLNLLVRSKPPLTTIPANNLDPQSMRLERLSFLSCRLCMKICSISQMMNSEQPLACSISKRWSDIDKKQTVQIMVLGMIMLSFLPLGLRLNTKAYTKEIVLFWV